MLILQPFQDPLHLNLLVYEQGAIALQSVGKIFNLFLRVLEPQKTSLVPPSHVVEVDSLFVVKGLVVVDIILEKVRGNVEVVLGLEEIRLG